MRFQLTSTVRTLALVAITTMTGQMYSAPSVQAGDLLTIGSTAPKLDIEHWVQNGGGKYPKVTEFKAGKVYVVEFWATWCGPCIQSMPHLAEMQEKYANKGVQIISISNEDLETVEEFLKKEAPSEGEDKTFNDITKVYCLTTDPDGSVNDSYMQAAKQNGIPCAFIVGKDSKIEWIGHPAEMDEPLEQVVEGKWDRAKFAAAFLEAQEEEAMMEEIQRKVSALMKKKKFPEALVVMDEYIEKAKKKNMKVAFTTMKLQLQRLAKSESKDFAKTFEGLIELAEADDYELIYRIAGNAFEMYEDGVLESKQVLKKTLGMVQASIEKLEGHEKAMMLESAAHLQYSLGDLKAAIESQKAAIKLSDADEIDEMNEFLADLEKQAKSPKK